jgi:predicted metal-dependent enzyme (double-stranded beta helix superfamily)
VVFDPERFVAACRTAAVEDDPTAAVSEVVAAAIGDGPSIDDALGGEYERVYPADELYSSPELTVRRVLWAPGGNAAPHDHRMWAVVGVYVGEEVNRLYQRSHDGLTECGGRVVAPGEVFVLDADGIHSVDNNRRGWTVGLHVYGGDLNAVANSAWGPDGREVTAREYGAAAMAMHQTWRALAAEYGKHIDDEAWYLANRALWEARERERRYPTSAEVRRLVADAWSLSL